MLPQHGIGPWRDDVCVSSFGSLLTSQCLLVFPPRHHPHDLDPIRGLYSSWLQMPAPRKKTLKLSIRRSTVGKRVFCVITKEDFSMYKAPDGTLLLRMKLNETKYARQSRSMGHGSQSVPNCLCDDTIPSKPPSNARQIGSLHSLTSCAPSPDHYCAVDPLIRTIPPERWPIPSASSASTGVLWCSLPQTTLFAASGRRGCAGGSETKWLPLALHGTRR